ncbi:peptidylprolyl isomerase [Solitalea koreensis]|uniref:Periplasmic chaperone for outer membrane proteins SurA n=1 Tax=Solitalea koreensis TaxID=543615 RepID=A0A521ARL8_9SPHI|nr:peptidylprolyl isomerase [Solitalea koreensis]SMO37425.1 periplasmic chaperone for outer membrane proteins SurA [Solitalea koreensis]
MKKIFTLLVAVCFAMGVSAQSKSVDKVVGVVADKIILQSDVESQYLEYLRQQNPPNEKVKCTILNELLLQKLLLTQAELDSITVEESQIDQTINQRIQYFISQVGSQEKLEKELLGKSVLQFKVDIRPQVREQLLARNMHAKITEGSTVSPAEVKAFYDKMPVDSLPLYSTEVEVGEIVRYPVYSKEEKDQAKAKLDALRARVRAGENFGTLAMLYSQDPGSARNNGEIGYFSRGQMVTPFEAVAFKLKPGEVSPVIETKFGFHIIQSIDRRGDQVNVRHILIRPEFTQKELDKAKADLDSAIHYINDKKMTFGEAAVAFSDDVDTRSSGGMFKNPENGRTGLIPMNTLGQMDQEVVSIIDTMKVGELSRPIPFISQGETKQGFRLIYFKSQSEPHRANLNLDYPRIQEAALSEKQQRIFNEWVVKKRAEKFIKVDADYASCNEVQPWLKKSK